ncbi:hypothetical protein WICMUC_000574 [Wickerhamomyces mucosus]|uniref:MATE efflux family protein n=1 Tax=Wickerhamomyces mucosus TaxID=1378264 RepID=A0A9P8PYQ1_9ASCO|nr:hypothetical protein WICMUC_000574 [Wickerhamomyces mucosus]
MGHSFKITNMQRRSSVVSGSLGKGLFFPQDDIQQPLQINNIEEETNEQTNDEYTSLLLMDNNDNGDINKSNNNKVNDELINQEEELLQKNHIKYNNKSKSDIISSWENSIELNDQKIKTNLFLEMQNLTFNSIPLMITFILQNSLSLTSIFIVGHIGKLELAGITLGSMTANITGLAALQGLATCLDTLCSQAYGAGKFELVGIQVIRCFTFAITCFIPIAILWWGYSFQILNLFIKDSELITIASNYLKIVSFGIPGFILFEVSKRFLQSQGVFHASSIVLLICAPLNFLISYLFVFNLKFGFIGTAYAIALNYWLMPLGLLIFIYFNQNLLKCWPKNLKIEQIFSNWSKLIELALPGIIMVEAEFLGFEITTIMASNLGTNELAAQSVLSSICSLAYQLPFSVSIATSTRVANFIGASLVENSKTTCNASMLLGLIIGITNCIILVTGQNKITSLFTNDSEVIEMVLKVFTLLGYIEIIDCLNSTSAGCLRGQGLQKIGGYINIFAFYVMGLPVSYLLTFVYDFSLVGLWLGITIGLSTIFILQCLTVFWISDWDKILQDAQKRNNDV